MKFFDTVSSCGKHYADPLRQIAERISRIGVKIFSFAVSFFGNDISVRPVRLSFIRRRGYKKKNDRMVSQQTVIQKYETIIISYFNHISFRDVAFPSPLSSQLRHE